MVITGTLSNGGSPTPLTIVLHVVNPCFTTIFTPSYNVIQDYTYNVGTGLNVITGPKIKSSIDDISICGFYQF